MKTACDRVKDSICEKIFSGELLPGARLTHRALAKEFKVSLGPVAQALRRLESVGLLERRADGASYMPEWSKEEVLDAHILREIFEGVAARLCAQRATDEDIAVLRVRLDKLQKKLERNEPHFAEEMAFHRGIVEFAHLPMLLQFYDNIAVIHRTFAGVPLLGMHNIPATKVLPLHPPLFEAIAARNPDEAERHARQHVREAYERIVEQTKKT